MKQETKQRSGKDYISWYLRIWIPIVLMLGGGLWLVYEMQARDRLSTLMEEERLLIEHGREIIQTHIQILQQDTLYLASDSALESFINSPRANMSRQLRQDLLNFARYRGLYDQVRLIDETGQELIRIHRQDGQLRISNEKALQNKASRPYVAKTLGLKKGELYLSQFDLNIENGVIEQPIKPVIRAASPLFDRQGKRRGLIVVNYLGQGLLDKLKSIRAKFNGDLWLLNDRGDWLLGPSPDMEWSFMYSIRSTGQFAQHFPSIWKTIQAQQAQQAQQIKKHDALFTTIHISPDYKIPGHLEETWRLVAHLSPQVLSNKMAGMGIFLFITFIALTILPVVVMSFLTYYTIKKKTDPIIKEGERRYRHLLESAPDAIVSANSEGTIILANSMAEKMFGYSRDEMLGKKVEMLVPPSMVEAHMASRIAYAKNPPSDPNRLPDLNLQGLHKDGTTFPVEINLSPTETSQGLTITSIIRDITARKEYEEHIKSLNTNLRKRTIEQEAANKELEAFCYSVSHDLRAPLRAIDGFSKTLDDKYADKLDETGRDRLARVRAAAQRMATLIDDLLKLSRISRTDIKREAIDLSNIAREVAEELQHGEPDRHVTFNIQDNLQCKADKQLLRVALDNLIGNAWKFTSKKENPQIDIGEQQNGKEHFYYIHDNGAGFDMQYANKLFGAFQRLHDNHEFPGTGIGLATVQRVVNKHGGHIWAESKVGQGSSFYFTI